jgi:PAS domain-containing protein
MDPVVAAPDDCSPGCRLFCVKAPDGRYLAINQAFADRAGRSATTLGRTAADLFPADLVAIREQDRRLYATGEPIRNELEMILRPDGSPRLVRHQQDVAAARRRWASWQ